MSPEFDRVGWEVTLRSAQEMAERLPECPVRIRVNGDPGPDGQKAARHDFLVTMEFFDDLAAQVRAVQLSHAQRERERALREIAGGESAEAEVANFRAAVMSTPRPDIALLRRVSRRLDDLDPAHGPAAPEQAGPGPDFPRREHLPPLPRRQVV
ncbi:hypothetical protein AB0M10_15360 [Streptomyces sp. NPDC051840]|uniref:hypothetical protein n=1 Tax=Streptomyces sp. NPDC051840 TaxID=3154752 RepID=UPI0034425C8B